MAELLRLVAIDVAGTAAVLAVVILLDLWRERRAARIDAEFERHVRGALRLSRPAHAALCAELADEAREVIVRSEMRKAGGLDDAVIAAYVDRWHAEMRRRYGR